MARRRRIPPVVPQELCGVWRRRSLSVGHFDQRPNGSGFSVVGHDIETHGRAMRAIAPRGQFAEVRISGGGVGPASSIGAAIWMPASSTMRWTRSIDLLNDEGVDITEIELTGATLRERATALVAGRPTVTESFWDRVSDEADTIIVVDDPDDRGRVMRIGDVAIGVRNRREAGSGFGAMVATRHTPGFWSTDFQLGRREDAPLPHDAWLGGKDIVYDISFAIDAGPRGDGVAVTTDGHKLWGLYGAAGVLLRHVDTAGVERFLLDHRSARVIQGGTWGVPGGAINRDESPVVGALREACEELGTTTLRGRIIGTHTSEPLSLEGGGPRQTWGYTTTILDVGSEVYHLRAVQNWESDEHRWVTRSEIARLPLHPGFADGLPGLYAIIDETSKKSPTTL